MANIRFQQESYKRGIVLGLTMAEIVLVVLFTLLLVLAGRLIDEEREAAKLKDQTAVSEAKLKDQIVLTEKIQKELERLTNHEIPDPNEFFRELVIAKEKAARTEDLERKLAEFQGALGKAQAAREQAERTAKAERVAREEAERRSGLNKGHKWPPIINLSEAEGYFFEVGSAELSDEFKTALVDKVVPKILEIADEYPDVDVIEVIGHTDEQIIRRRYSNLDVALVDVVRNGNIGSLVPADNAGLGIARAVAVVTRLLQDSRLQRFERILPMSGAQLIQVDETLSRGSEGDVRERRRIEIRLRKYENASPDTVTKR